MAPGTPLGALVSPPRQHMSSRRDFLSRLSRLSLVAAGMPAIAPWLRPRWQDDPFALGVASGDPTPNGVVLWTRLAPRPLEGGGMPPANVDVMWEVATDDAMRRVVRRGTAVASPDWAHAVHVELDGLQPGRWYWYRFRAGDATSVVARTRTMPGPRARLREWRFAVASCQHWEQGYYTAYRHLAHEDLDLVVHLGDYIYESTAPGRTRSHGTPPPTTLDEYRARYALYKTDADLQAAHAVVPWVVTWDDHEVENNYAGDVSSPERPREEFLLQRAAAYRAYYEHQPLRRAAIPKGPDMLLYRTVAVAGLARFHVLDTRQYRHDQVCGDGRRAPCAEWYDPRRSMLGAMQERWLERGLTASRTRWNVLAQQVNFAPINNDPGEAEHYSMDAWSGYPQARDRLARFLEARRVPNVVVLTGDIHAHFAADVRGDYRRADAPAIAAEFVTTSISSGGDGSDGWANAASMLQRNPWIRYHRNRRGYVRCLVTESQWRSDFRALPYVERPGAPVSTDASWVTEAGRPGLHAG